jgi:hypothetical protein
VVSGPEARRGQGAGPEDKRVISGIEAKLGVMRYVLIISMSLVVLGFVVAWVVERF